MTQDLKVKTETVDELEEQNVYAGVYHALVAGMLASTTLFFIGIVAALLHPQFIPLTPEWIKAHYHWTVVLRGLAQADPATIMMVATVLLILTPITRVLVSIRAFAADHDWKFVAITSTVFGVIAMAVLLGELGLK